MDSKRIEEIKSAIEELSKTAKLFALDYQRIKAVKYHSRIGELSMIEIKLREIVYKIDLLKSEKARIENGFIGKDIGGYTLSKLKQNIKEYQSRK